MVRTFIGTFCKYTTCIMRSLRRNPRCYWSVVDCDGRATCSWNRLTALLLGRLLGVLLFTEARSMGPAVQWSPMKPESWSVWLPLKSSPTCSCRWLHCDLQNVPRDLLELYVLTGPRHLHYWLNWTELRRLLNCLEADPSENTARNNTCCDCWLPWKSYLSGCCLDTDLRKRYLVTGIPNMWEVSMGGSHTPHYAGGWWAGGIAPCILNLSTRWEWQAS
jgi:hypothetical protein